MAEQQPFFCADCDAELKSGEGVRKKDGRVICQKCEQKLRDKAERGRQADLFVEQSSLFNPARRRNVPGFKDRAGQFHPIRAGKGYNEFLAGDFEPRKRPTQKEQREIEKWQRQETKRIREEVDAPKRSLAQFVRAYGGIVPGGMYAGEIRRLGYHETGTTGLLNQKARIGSHKQTAQYVMDAANEEGYRDRHGERFTSIGDFLAAVEQSAVKGISKSGRKADTAKQKRAKQMARAMSNPEHTDQWWAARVKELFSSGFFLSETPHGGNANSAIASFLLERVDHSQAKRVMRLLGKKWPASIEVNPHKSYSRLSARRSKKAAEVVKMGREFERAGLAMGDPNLRLRGMTLQRRGMRSGEGHILKGGTVVEGPVGQLPNPDYRDMASRPIITIGGTQYRVLSSYSPAEHESVGRKNLASMMREHNQVADLYLTKVNGKQVFSAIQYADGSYSRPNSLGRGFVWSEPKANPRKPKFKRGDLVYSYQNRDRKEPISHIEDRGPGYGYHYKLALHDKDGYSHSSHWIAESSLSKSKQNPQSRRYGQRAQMTKQTFDILVKEYGREAAHKALAFWNSQPASFRAGVKALPFLRDNEYLWRSLSNPDPWLGTPEPRKSRAKKCAENPEAIHIDAGHVGANQQLNPSEQHIDAGHVTIVNPKKRDKFSRKVSQLVREGYPQKQAVAIAFSEQRAGKLNPAKAPRGSSEKHFYVSADVAGTHDAYPKYESVQVNAPNKTQALKIGRETLRGLYKNAKRFEVAGPFHTRLSASYAIKAEQASVRRHARKHNSVFSNYRMIKAHDRALIKKAEHNARVEAINAEIKEVKYDPWFNRRENKTLQRITIEKLKDRKEKLTGKRNPSVTNLSKTFQGKADGATQELKAANSAPANLARAGKLVFLKVAGKSIRIPGAVVAIAPNEKLWIVGDHAPLFASKAQPGTQADYGEVSEICYETAKAHIGKGKRFEYVHEFGENGGRRPHLLIDSEGMPILRGGDYKIRAEGIVN